jgi:hypothetical protein
MAPTLALCALALVVVIGLAWSVLVRERTDETERFHRASEITSSWAEPGPHFQTVPEVAAGRAGEPAAAEGSRDGARRSA